MLHCDSVKQGLCLTLTCAVIAWSGAAHAQMGGGDQSGQDGQKDEGQSTKKQTPSVKLLDAGTGEKRKLRYDLEAGNTEDGTLRMSVSTETQMGEQGSREQVLPRIILPYEAEVLQEDGNGRRNVEVTFTDYKVEKVEGVNEQMMAGFKSMLNGLKGAKVTFAVSPRGVTSEMDMEFAEGVSPQINRIIQPVTILLQATTVQFPEKPVGKNAEWEMETGADMEGVDAEASHTVTVNRLKKNTVQLEIETSVNADEQEVEGQGGQSFTLINLEETGGGQSTIAFDNVLPRKANTKTERSVAYKQETQQGSMQMKNVSVQELTISSEKVDVSSGE